MTKRRCSGCRKILLTGGSLLCAACATLLPIQNQAKPGHSVTVVTSVQSPSPIALQPVKSSSDDTLPADDQPHDHREYEADPARGAEYGTADGTASTVSFSSTPGKAVPGRATPEMP